MAPHHFTLTDESLARPIKYDTNCKMNPPLREAADVEAMIGGHRATAPSTSSPPIMRRTTPTRSTSSSTGRRSASSGSKRACRWCSTGWSTAGVITHAAVRRAAVAEPGAHPAPPGGTLAPGAVADITVLAPDARVTVRAASLRSKSKNTPFDGWELRGAAAATIVGGRTVFVNDAVTGADVFA